MPLSRELALGFPARKRVTLKYADTYQLLSTAGATATQTIAVNSCFLPDVTGTGHQPRGFDQWCTTTGPYTKYRVLAVRAVIEATLNGGGATPGTMSAGFGPTSTAPTAASGSQSTTIQSSAELRGWKGAIIPLGSSPPIKLAFSANIADVKGVRQTTVTDEDNYAAASGASPVDLAYFFIQYAGVEATTNLLIANLELEMDVQFEQPILIAAS